MLPANFVFAVHVVSGGPRFDEALGHVAAGILTHAGYGDAEASALTDELRAALAGAARAGEAYDLRFDADGGQFHVEVTRGAKSVWRTSRALP